MEHVRKRGLAVVIGVAFLAAAVGLLDASSQPKIHHQVASTPLAPVTIGFIGDSITDGPDDGAKTAVEVEVATLGDNYKAVNRGKDGTTTEDWQPGGKLYDEALTEFKKEGVHTVSLMLGTNDAAARHSVSPEAYRHNLETIIHSLLRSGQITRVVVNYPPYTVPGSSGHKSSRSQELLAAYRTEIDTLGTIEGVAIGDTSAYDYFKDHQSELADGVHPTNEGYEQLGKLWAKGYEKALAKTQR